MYVAVGVREGGYQETGKGPMRGRELLSPENSCIIKSQKLTSMLY